MGVWKKGLTKKFLISRGGVNCGGEKVYDIAGVTEILILVDSITKIICSFIKRLAVAETQRNAICAAYE